MLFKKALLHSLLSNAADSSLHITFATPIPLSSATVFDTKIPHSFVKDLRFLFFYFYMQQSDLKVWSYLTTRRTSES